MSLNLRYWQNIWIYTIRSKQINHKFWINNLKKLNPYNCENKDKIEVLGSFKSLLNFK